MVNFIYWLLFSAVIVSLILGAIESNSGGAWDYLDEDDDDYSLEDDNG